MNSGRLKVLLAGSHGFLGHHLSAQLAAAGHEVVPLLRHAPPGSQGLLWQPGAPLPAATLDGVDVVVNLAGAPTMGNPHSRKWARNLRRSRVDGTRTLAEAVAARPHPPALVLGGGISWYGDHGAHELTESSDSRGDALLTSVCREWEAAAEPARRAGARVAVMRTAPVLDVSSAPLKAQRLQFRLGLGGRIGAGDQYFPVISLTDWVNAAAFLVSSQDLSGPFNMCCPSTPTNAEYTTALASATRRPAVLHAPAAVVKVAAGAMAPEVLGSLNARPAALERAGFDFEHGNVQEILAATMDLTDV